MTDLPEIPLKIVHIPEPLLSFGHAQQSDYPKDGLYLYGPYGAVQRKHVTLGVIGTQQGIELWTAWLERAQGIIRVPKPGKREKKFRPHLSDFPGISEAFGIHVDPREMVSYIVQNEEIDNCLTFENHFETVRKTVDLYLSHVERHNRDEEKTIDVWIIVVPELVFQICRPNSDSRKLEDLHPGKFPRKQSTREILPLLESVLENQAEDIFDDAADFHRQIKARMLKYGQPCQLIRETTLAPEKFLNRAGHPVRGTQDPATVAWNIATALYYKSQPEPPWKVAHMREDVCYVGLVFKMLINNRENHACCAAQMFLSEGDGVVFRGANGPWSTDGFEFHLSADAAKGLIDTVLQTYRLKFKRNPRELFIHGRTKFNDEEWEAFSSATPPETNLVAVRIQPTKGEAKLFRDGDYPCIRGTALILGERDAYL